MIQDNLCNHSGTNYPTRYYKNPDSIDYHLHMDL